MPTKHVSSLPMARDCRKEKKKKVLWFNNKPVLISNAKLWNDEENQFQYNPVCSTKSMITIIEAMMLMPDTDEASKLRGLAMIKEWKMEKQPPTEIVDVTSLQLNRNQRKRRNRKSKKEALLSEEMECLSVEALLQEFKS
jgi:hypothetical protein